MTDKTRDAPHGAADTDRLHILNETADGTGSHLPSFGTLTTRAGDTVFGIRHGDDVMVLPGEHAIDFCLSFAQFVAEHTGAMDNTLVARLVWQTIELHMALAAFDSARWPNVTDRALLLELHAKVDAMRTAQEAVKREIDAEHRKVMQDVLELVGVPPDRMLQ